MLKGRRLGTSLISSRTVDVDFLGHDTACRAGDGGSVFI